MARSENRGALMRQPRGRDPFQDVEVLYDGMSRLLTSAFPDVARIIVDDWSLPVDIEETEDAYIVEADLPGVKADDITIDVQGRELRIVGELRERERTGILRRRARRSGRFDYRVTLPGEVDAKSCQADVEDGVVRLTLPKTATSRRQRIPVGNGHAAELPEGTPYPDEQRQGERAATTTSG
ncbi:MAG: hypothetical protein QOE45_301 [Frankiaceae bacterium]|jgi:HSP20 family protein|nr:hypothetical protein [Frankiaceae bacterium]